MHGNELGEAAQWRKLEEMVKAANKVWTGASIAAELSHLNGIDAKFLIVGGPIRQPKMTVLVKKTYVAPIQLRPWAA